MVKHKISCFSKTFTVFLTIILIFAIFHYERQQHASQSMTVTIPFSLFVIALGRDLYLQGELFHFVGVNRYNLLATQSQCASSWTDKQLDTYFVEMKSLHISAVRFWAFQSMTKEGTDFSRFDYILSLAQKYNVRLIPVLENQWTNCTMGGYKYDTWYQAGYLGSYGYALTLKDYTKRLVNRYKNNPYILMWQIMNEAESQNTHGNADPQALYHFANDMSSYIKLLDANHLVNLGTIGGGQPGTGGNDYRTLYRIPSLDLLEFHDYGDATNAAPANIAQRFTDSIILNKPLFVGEAGIRINCPGADCYTKKQRAFFFQAKMQSFFAHRGAGYMIWSYHGNPVNPNDEYEFDVSDPLAIIVATLGSHYSPPQLIALLRSTGLSR